MTKTVPYKRCEALENRIVRRIREGASLSDAPRLEGIDEATFRRWRQCKREKDDPTLSPRDRRCWHCANCALQGKCDEAESHFRQSCVEVIHKAGKKNWRAMAWILEHRYRDEYTKREIIEVKDEIQRSDPSMELIKFITRRTGASREKGVRSPRMPPDCADSGRRA